MTNTTIPDAEHESEDDWCLFVAAPVDAAFVGVRRALARGATIELGRDDTTFAAGVFADGRASRRHAQITVDDAGVLRVADLGSSNGTYVNGARIERVSLNVGDVVRVGAALLVVQKTPPRFSLPKSPLIGVGPAIARMQAELARALGAGRPIAIVEEPGSGALSLAHEINRVRGAARVHEWAVGAWSDRLPSALDRAFDERDATIVLVGLPQRRTIARSLVIERLRAAANAPSPQLVVILDAGQSYEPDLREALATVHVPPLRDRPEDLVPIAFEWAKARSIELPPLSTKAWLTMLRSPWPGNVAHFEATLNLAADGLARTHDEPIEKWIRDAASREPPSRVATTTVADETDAFVFARSGKWFTLATGERVSLHRHKVLSRVLSALVEARATRPGRVIRGDELLAIAWAGERFVDGSGENRLHVALTSLRQLGLRPILERVEDGYRLDPSIRTRITDD
ncbi:MAG: FHA domain-containing protein [Myxococcales bacterium]|nr:FHA domain-containing protein [Myxococcales bacterium]